MEMRERWLDRILGVGTPGDARPPTTPRTCAGCRRSADVYSKERATEVCLATLTRARLRPRGRQEHPHRPRGPPAEDAAPVRDPGRSADGRPPHHPAAGRASRLPGLPPRGRPRAALRRLRPGSPVHVPCAVARSRADRDLLVPHRVDHPRAGLARAALRPVVRAGGRERRGDDLPPLVPLQALRREVPLRDGLLVALPRGRRARRRATPTG